MWAGRHAQDLDEVPDRDAKQRRGRGTTIASPGDMHLVELRTLRTRIVACGWRSVVLRAVALGAGWWILDEGEPALAFGVPVVLAALFASVFLPSPRPPSWHLLGLLQFIAVFIIGSVRGGLDVARRALAPRLPISPTVKPYTLRLTGGAARNLFLGTVSLMPGTLCLDRDGARLEVHVLADDGGAFAREFEVLERCIARALGEPLEGTHA